MNDSCSGAIALSENVYYPQNTANATDDGASTCLSRTKTKGVWFTYTPSQTGTATVDTCPSDFDTMVEIFSGTCGALTSIGCKDDNGPACSGTRASQSFNCTAGTTYRIWTGGYNGALGSLLIRAYGGTRLEAHIDPAALRIILHWLTKPGAYYYLEYTECMLPQCMTNWQVLLGGPRHERSSRGERPTRRAEPVLSAEIFPINDTPDCPRLNRRSPTTRL